MRTTKRIGPRGPRKVRARTIAANNLEFQNSHRKPIGLPPLPKPKRTK